jgi:DNA-binding GntR family transcriptional regulator
MPVPTKVIRLDRRPARHLVHEQFRAWIEEGVLEPGEVIRDAEIAEALGVSRTPVREALQMLERDGAVEMLPGRLTRVTALHPEDVALLYKPLAVLHGLAAELAAERAGAAALASLDGHNTRLRDALAVKDAAGARDADSAFHRVIVDLAANPYLVIALEPLTTQARRPEALYFRGVELGMQSYEDHCAIVGAMRAGDADAAGARTRANFERYWRPPSQA